MTKKRGNHQAKRTHHVRPVMVLVVSALLAGIGGGSAWGYFTATSSGSGVASIGTGQTVAVDAVVGTGNLYPGGVANLSFTLDNPNDYPVTIVAIAGAGTISVAGTPGCTATDAGVSVLPRSDLAVSVRPGSTVQVVIADDVQMDTTAADACQGATFHVPIALKMEKR